MRTAPWLPSEGIESKTRLTAHPPSVGAARRFVRDVLVTRHVAPQVVETVELLTSEVVTNAILHTESAPELVVRVGDGRVRVEVHDGSSTVPVVLQPDPYEQSGRGMAIVDRLARAWGVEHVPTGKRVWFEVPFSAAPLPSWARDRAYTRPRRPAT